MFDGGVKRAGKKESEYSVRGQKRNGEHVLSKSLHNYVGIKKKKGG